MKKVLVILAIGMLIGCSSNDIESKQHEEKIEEPQIKKDQYDVVWGSYDNEWVYSDEWTGEGFENFDEAMNVLDQCMSESEEETENCVYEFLHNKIINEG
ncbi:hypothetical protein [Fredinandcohnia onubensis]|uniref:hypothetical protein n=1 Tax=Fredinandcohnia onubensis TaxID=1571209 RepID=UPI000C0BF49B|nr:hypothetical protein [Fredinandcohnia onubensis]